MDQVHYEEMKSNLDKLIQGNRIQNKKIYLFGHCNATEKLAELLKEKGFYAEAILDNSVAKQGKEFGGIAIKNPMSILTEDAESTIVCIVARAYAEMVDQLNRLGYRGVVYKLADYNSYAEYSLSEDTISRKWKRVEDGIRILQEMERKHPAYFRILCPFCALGDVYFVMSYLPHFLKKRNLCKVVIGVIGKACAQVAGLFGTYEIEVLAQKDMDSAVQAAIYIEDTNSFIAHQDRPYVVNLHRALYLKCIPLEKVYCCGVFGLPENTKAYEPVCLREYGSLGQIRQGRAVILSPYAKSVTELPDAVWAQIVESFLGRGYQCYTNVVGDEEPLPGTMPLSPSISEMKSVVEWAGIFIGIRSGLCDVLKTANCRKVALYPDYFYCDTKWKAIDIYALDGWENIVVKDGFRWEKN